MQPSNDLKAKPFTTAEALAWLEEIRDVRKTILDPAEYLRLFQANIDRVKATIERLRGALEPFAKFTETVLFKAKAKNRFVKAVLECEDFRKAQQAIEKEKKPC